MAIIQPIQKIEMIKSKGKERFRRTYRATCTNCNAVTIEKSLINQIDLKIHQHIGNYILIYYIYTYIHTRTYIHAHTYIHTYIHT